jgi:hypothetical protein
MSSGVCDFQVPTSCCQSRRQAASHGHYACYKQLLSQEPEGPNACLDLFQCLSLALRLGNGDFAEQLFVDRGVVASDFAYFCAVTDDPVSLRYVMDIAPGQDLGLLCRVAAVTSCVDCIRTLLEWGVPWTPWRLLYACRDNRFDVLEIVLAHSREWCSLVPSVAGAAGNVRFLMRVFHASCPGWTQAQDGEPRVIGLGIVHPSLYVPAKDRWVYFRDWGLVVPSDLVCSGPVLLLAAQKGAPMTPRMEGMLREVRRRALAVAGCFHRATRLSQGPRPAARKWDAMGRVPVELVQSIATLARLSIVAVELVE